jgi:hypothetical protein
MSFDRKGCQLSIGAVVAALAVAGCGSSSSGTLGKTALAAKANSICTGTNSALKKLTPPTANTTTAYVPFLKVQVSVLTSERDHINALNPDSTVKSDRDAYVANESQTISVLQKAYGDAVAHNLQAMTSALQTTSKFGQATLAAAKRLGWTECTKTS